MKIGAGPVWIEVFPFKKLRERRKAKRAAKRGETVSHTDEVSMTTETEPTKRTSTKAGGAMGAGTAIIALIGVFFPEAMDSMSPETVAILASFATAIVGWIAARLSKTPAKPGAL